MIYISRPQLTRFVCFSLPTRTPLLAGYFFADGPTAKYLSQHLACHLSCINQIPVQLLVGPAAPTAHPVAYLHRYSRDMFSVARPQFVEPLPAELQPADHLLLEDASPPGVSAASLRAAAVKPLKPTGQPKNEIMGFFETGILIGASITLSVVLPLLGYTTYTLGRKGLELAMRLRR